jgi:ligand-binding SRPBCC domain-containing protein
VVHRHEFEAGGVATRLTDRIEHELPGGAFGNTLFAWTATLGLRRMFAYRHRVT